MPAWLTDLIVLLAALAPVFVLVGLGLLLRGIRLISPAGVEELNRLVYWTALPAQLFVVVSATDVRHHFDPGALLAALSGFALGLAVSWVATARLGPAARGSIVSGVARPNAAFIGLPVVQLVAKTMPPDQAQAMLTAFSVLLGMMVACFNIGAVAAFLLPHHGLNRAGLWRAVAALPTNPLIIGCAAGVVASLIQPGLLAGTVPGRSLELYAGTAIPLALVLTGLQLDLALMRRNTRLLALASAGKLLLVPLLTLAVGWWVGVEHGALTAAVVMMACPVAMASAPMARLLGGDADLMAAFIVATTVAAPFTLLGWLMFLR